MTRPLVLLLVLLASARPLLADEGDGKPPKRTAFDFGEGPKPTGPAAPAEGTAPEGAPEAPADPEAVAIEKEIRALSQWPDRPAVHAAESLLLRGPVAVPYLVRTLNTKDSPSQPGAAWVLGKVGEPAHVVVILRAAAERTNGSRVEDLFEAAYGLDPVRTKEWLFSFLTVMGRPVFRENATKFLAAKAAPEDQDKVLKLLVAPKPEVRVVGLRLLGPAGVPDASERLMTALADVSPEVASTAGRLLASKADARLLLRLNVQARDGEARDRAYAILALAEAARAQGPAVFEPQTLSEMAGRRGLLHPERLSRGAAAVGLAFGALETEDRALRDLLDSTVVDVLIDTVGGEHFRDYSSLTAPVFAALRRLSGLDLPETAADWVDKWWRTQRGKFHARRPLTTVAEDDVPMAWIRFDAIEANGRRVRATFTSEEASREGAFLLPRPAFRALVDALGEAGIFEAAAPTRPSASEQLAITLGVMNQERRLVLGPDDPRYALLRARFASLEEANAWQRYRDVDQWKDGREWWQATARAMEDSEPVARKALLVAAIVHAFDDLEGDEAREEALDRLDAMEAELTATEVRALALAAVSARSFGSIESRALRLALAQPKAAEARSDLLELVAARPEGEARGMLVALLVEGGSEEVRGAFADVRPAVREAAARGAARLMDAATPEARKLLAESFKPGLEVLANDADRTVAVAALLGLAHTGEESVLPALESLYRKGDLGTKVAVAEALGAIAGDRAHPLLSLVLAEERAEGSGALRAAALRSLARTRHPNAVAMLGHYLLNDVDPEVQRAAADAFGELGGDEARFYVVDLLTRAQAPEASKRARLVDVLGRFGGKLAAEVLRKHLEDPDPSVVLVAALRLGEQGDAAAVPYLIQILRSGGEADRDAARASLELVTSTRFDVVASAEAARLYDEWFATAKGGTERTWFRDALRRAGYETGALNAWIQGEADLAAVPVFLRALRDEDPVVRRNAATALEGITGRGFGTVDRSTSLGDAARVAQRWEEWWQSVSGPARPR